jgi:hypothetical protein
MSAVNSSTRFSLNKISHTAAQRRNVNKQKYYCDLRCAVAPPREKTNFEKWRLPISLTLFTIRAALR